MRIYLSKKFQGILTPPQIRVLQQPRRIIAVPGYRPERHKCAHERTSASVSVYQRRGMAEPAGRRSVTSEPNEWAHTNHRVERLDRAVRKRDQVGQDVVGISQPTDEEVRDNLSPVMTRAPSSRAEGLWSATMLECMRHDTTQFALLERNSLKAGAYQTN